MAIVTIPFDYDPVKYGGALVPIFLNDTDEKGRRIYRGWIEAVIPVHERLITLAKRILSDPWRVSELTDVTVHHLWGKYGSEVGPNPSHRVYVTARRKAHGLEDPGARLYLRKNVALDSLADYQRDILLTRACDRDGELDHQRNVYKLETKLRDLGTPQDFLVYQKLKSGYHWREIGDAVDEKPNTVHRRFKRLLQRIKDSI
jgi:DNA-directed RNA polymerase specialized sigma24 family protein